MIRIRANIGEALAGLRRLQAVLGDLTSVMQDIGEYLVDATRRRFGAGRSPDGVPWAPKSPVTMEAARRRGDKTDSRPLIGVARRLSREIHYRASSTQVEVGSSLIYAAVQQLGAAKGQFGRDRRKHPIPWGRIPARPFLGLSERDQTAIGEIVTEALVRAAGPGAR
ncbi:MAG: phage virion morphogenesis protein [Variibacter sp.]|nr:phage virion morphogenesis protein [Variibacter sp.]